MRASRDQGAILVAIEDAVLVRNASAILVARCVTHLQVEFIRVRCR